MAKVVPVCSSSKGNSVFVGDSTSGVLVDAGCSFKALRKVWHSAVYRLRR